MSALHTHTCTQLSIFSNRKLPLSFFWFYFLGGFRIEFMTLHPGNVSTDVVRTLPKLVQKAYGIVMPLFLLTPAQGARSTIYTALDSNAHEESEQALHYFNSNCKPQMPSREARDTKQGAKLWTWTMKQINPYLSPQVKSMLQEQ